MLGHTCSLRTRKCPRWKHCGWRKNTLSDCLICSIAEPASVSEYSQEDMPTCHYQCQPGIWKKDGQSQQSFCQNQKGLFYPQEYPLEATTLVPSRIPHKLGTAQNWQTRKHCDKMLNCHLSQQATECQNIKEFCSFKPRVVHWRRLLYWMTPAVLNQPVKNWFLISKGMRKKTISGRDRYPRLLQPPRRKLPKLKVAPPHACCHIS